MKELNTSRCTQPNHLVQGKPQLSLDMGKGTFGRFRTSKRHHFDEISRFLGKEQPSFCIFQRKLWISLELCLKTKQQEAPSERNSHFNSSHALCELGCPCATESTELSSSTPWRLPVCPFAMASLECSPQKSGNGFIGFNPTWVCLFLLCDVLRLAPKNYGFPFGVPSPLKGGLKNHKPKQRGAL